MPRIHDYLGDDDSPGHIRIDALRSGCLRVYYVPSPERLALWRLVHEDDYDPLPPIPEEALLLSLNTTSRNLTIFPLITRFTSLDFLAPKHEQVTRITFGNAAWFPDDDLPADEYGVMALLEDLPKGFTKDYDYGLGLAQPYRPIVSAIEQLTPCNHILLCDNEEDYRSASPDTYVITNREFQALRRSIDNTIRTSQTAARAVKLATTYNHFASKQDAPRRPIAIGRSRLRQALTSHALGINDALELPIPQVDQDALVTLLAKNSEVIARNKPAALVELKSNLELATLDTLISQCESMLKRKLPESKWQTYLNDNALLLTLAFGYPIIRVQDQASMGGRTLRGTGDSITDFLVKNSMTNNVAIIEIKTPHTKLLNKRPTRTGVFSPSNDFVGAINQALDQKRNFERHVSTIKDDSRIHDLESYSVHCCLIIGMMPAEEEQRKSFEMFRGNSKDVAIVTFDELLEKLKNLKYFLRSSEGVEESGARQTNEADSLPFP